MKLLVLIKKDFMLVKTYILYMLAFSLLYPVFILWRLESSEYVNMLAFVILVVFNIFILLQQVSLKENQYAKAAALLCAAPYPRWLFVLSKYCFCIIIFAASCVIFLLETLILPGLGRFDLRMAALLLLAMSVLLGLYLPAQFKLGFEKTKFVFIMVMMAIPFALPLLAKLNIWTAFDFVSRVSPAVLVCISLPASAMVLLLSILAAVKFYERQDLL